MRTWKLVSRFYSLENLTLGATPLELPVKGVSAQLVITANPNAVIDGLPPNTFLLTGAAVHGPIDVRWPVVHGPGGFPVLYDFRLRFGLPDPSPVGALRGFLMVVDMVPA